MWSAGRGVAKGRGEGELAEGTQGGAETRGEDEGEQGELRARVRSAAKWYGRGRGGVAIGVRKQGRVAGADASERPERSELRVGKGTKGPSRGERDEGGEGCRTKCTQANHGWRRGGGQGTGGG